MTDAAGQLAIRPASSDDVDTVAGILAEAARWLAARGIEQWPADGFPVADIRDRIARGETYVAEADGHAVATISLDWADPDMWGAAGTDGAAVYVHRLAVLRSAAGRRIGEQLLAWAAAQALAAGRAQVRLDCVTANAQLCRYYVDRGWTHVRDITDEIGTESLFQREAWSEVTATR
ncbi:GNAT family N-acetyltransferase [Pseudofrankia sp. DC12]|uniref:GNAT family N-acetyltransferase n=1 Tax=Pseudofrankia sp. DC12 TaxID=683315 RepID=UPI0005F7E42D|nr:GNAT family N-acetyltransferase [Pseudofrankia sp. DC12]